MSSQAELESRAIAEASREKAWRGVSFIRDLFLGRLRLDLVLPYPLAEPERPKFRRFYDRLERFLREEVDPVAIDESGEYPQRVVRGLADLGAFGMKIPEEYGGLGLTHPEYVRVMKLLGSYDANVTALLSAHQAIGVPQPVKLFGSDYLKNAYLPRCARGAISAFALTEPAVGSDPGRLESVAELAEDGTHWLLNGEKLWCTNGTLAELLVVMARDPRSGRINAFVVETGWPGVKVEHRCRFMGLKALANAEISFRNVRIPRENLIGEEGAGLKIALVTLNTGRLSLPAATTGLVKSALETCRKWCNARVQWGVPIGRHEAVAHKLAGLATSAFAMESIADLVADLADRPGVDIRLEAAAAKEWNTVRNWHSLDDALQIRGGRGYETERSLAARGEPAIGIERNLRDARINLIFEGSSEVMHLFMAREAVDKHLEVAGALVDPKATWKDKLAALPKIVAFYAWWYPSRWLGWARWPRYSEHGHLARHLRFADRASRRLARSVFHGMVLYRARLERKQAFLFRAVDIAMELFAMTASVGRALRMGELGAAEARSARVLADVFARSTRRRIEHLFRDLWHNDDSMAYALGRAVLDGEHEWLERGTMGVPWTIEEMTPPAMKRIFAARRPEPTPTETVHRDVG
jgi:alkylation response protein AidB-like acyl-CoA dehydrogenase